MAASTVLESILLSCAVLAGALRAQVQFGPAEKQQLPFLYEEHATVAGDVDGDGDIDLFARNLMTGGTRLWRNLGHARFFDDTAASLPAGVSFDLMLDADGDGDLDLAANDTDHWLLNDGFGHFAVGPAGAFPSAGWWAAVAGDLDGDHRTDLLVRVSGSMRVWIGDGTGRFADRTTTYWPAGTPPPESASLADLDGDGRSEVVGLSGLGQPRVWFHGPLGTLVDESASRLPTLPSRFSSLTTADLDGDGAAEILLTATGEPDVLLRNDGSGHFTRADGPGWPAHTGTTYAILVCDLDGDGIADLVFSDPDAPRLFRGTGHAEFVDVSLRLPRAELAQIAPEGVLIHIATDLDGDGDADLILAAAWDLLLLQDRSGAFRIADPPPLPMLRAESHAFATLDLEGDGDPDLVLAAHTANPNPPRGLQIYVNDGTGRFVDDSVARLPEGLERAYDVAVLDADGDGLDDLAVFGSESRILFGRPGGHFVLGPSLPTAEMAEHRVRVLDADHDHRPDLLLFGAGGLTLWQNVGEGRFVDRSAAWLPAVEGWVTGCVVGDFDHDRFPDILASADLTHFLRGTRDGRFVDETATRLPSDCRTVVMASVDLDGDHDLDVVGVNVTGIGILQNLHGQRFAAEILPVDPDHCTDIAAADFDDDGDVDLYLVRRITPDTLLLGDGRGRYTDASLERIDEPDAFAAQHDVVPLDIDRDGDLDLVFAVGDVRHEHDLVFVNGHRQLRAPYLPQTGADWVLEVSASPGYATRDAWVFGAIACGTVPGVTTPIGTWRLDPRTTAPLFLTRTTAPAGTASVRIPIPAVAALDGLAIAAQAAILEPGRGLHLTGVVSARVIR
ncbi:MAG: VCBS repeat-containing protein [Planctomycetota bacterium]